jgi:outer membrane receptor for ferric coprogen and ferric-rhodotorulic acid
MKQRFLVTVCALAAGVAMVEVHAAEEDLSFERVVVKGKRANRVSKGATGLPMEIKDTPQTISTIDQEDINDFGLTGTNEALRLGTGINVEQYETNRAVYNARGFEIQLTQIDGLGMTNDWGTVVGQQDTFLFERIELIRGANGLLTGVGNASGTINYVRKRPKNEDGGVVSVQAGSYGRKRIAADYNKVLNEAGTWAGRLVVAHEDKDSYLRGLNDRRTTLYGVVDGQIGTNGVLTSGFTYQKSKQKSPMWGSLTLNRVDGTQAEFDRSASTSQDWTYWNTESKSAFVEYLHRLGDDWEVKATYTHREGTEDTRLLYAYSASGNGLNLDNTGLVGWPYAGHTDTRNDIVDVNLNGQFSAFGRQHTLITGLSHSRQTSDSYALDATGYIGQALPAFPYGGNVFAEPAWGAISSRTHGEQQLTRLYAATRLALTDRLKGVFGLNAVQLKREGSSLYGTAATTNAYPNTKKASPYAGLTYDFTPNVLGYVSYSNIFQNQDQTDATGAYLAPMKGVNAETGVKAEWLDKKLLTTFALFSAKQKGLATYAGMSQQTQVSWYEPKDVKSEGFEAEATGRISKDAKMTVGFTRMKLTGPDGNDIYEWVPRTTFNARFDTRIPLVPGLRAGIDGRWQSDVYKIGGARQAAYFLANGFVSYELTDAATLRLNVNNLFDKKYIGGIAYGAIYGAPRNAAVTLDYKL